MIFYIHGFNSWKGSDKTKMLAEYFIGKESVEGLCYNSGSTSDIIEHSLSLQILNSALEFESMTFVGTSLGAFWSARMAYKFNGRAVLLNPSSDPVHSLLKYKGHNRNFRTGEEYTLTRFVIDSYGNHYTPKGVVPTIVALDEGDEVLNYKDTIEYYKGTCEIITFSGGSHQFEHLDKLLPRIEGFTNTFLGDDD